METNRKTHISFPADGGDKEKVVWLLNNVHVTPILTSLGAYCLTTEISASLVKNYIIDNIDTHISSGFNRKQIQLRFSKEFILWLENKAVEYSHIESPYHTSLHNARDRITETRHKQRQERSRLIKLLEDRDGREGCYDCHTVGVHYEFDHIDPSQKSRGVGYFLGGNRWKEAEEEALKCQLRCSGCHRMKTGLSMRNKQKKCVSTGDLKTNKRREQLRIHHAKRRDKHRERFICAKLKAGKCNICHKICIRENVTSFDFDHLDINTKRYNISCMVSRRNQLFEEEIAKCRLLCTECHFKITQEQRDCGYLWEKSQATQKNLKRSVII